jgi:hypothetical protein
MLFKGAWFPDHALRAVRDDVRITRCALSGMTGCHVTLARGSHVTRAPEPEPRFFWTELMHFHSAWVVDQVRNDSLSPGRGISQLDDFHLGTATR